MGSLHVNVSRRSLQTTIIPSVVESQEVPSHKKSVAGVWEHVSMDHMYMYHICSLITTIAHICS